MKQYLITFFGFISLLFISQNIFAQSDPETGNFEIFIDKNNPVFNIAGQFSYAVSDSEVGEIAKRFSETGYNIRSAQSVNTLGFHLYEKQAYKEASVIFKKAVMLNPHYLHAHYNLACMLSLISKSPDRSQMEEIIYHLQYACLLSPSYFDQLMTDPDLDPVRKDPDFIRFIELIGKGSISISGDSVNCRIPGKTEFIAKAVSGSSGPVELGPVIRHSPDRSAVMFFARYKGKFSLCIVTRYGLLVPVNQSAVPSKEEVFGLSFSWSPDSGKIAFFKNDGLYIYSVGADRSKRILEIPRKSGTDLFISETRELTFISSSQLRFMGGSVIEYQFSGYEYEINIDGTNFHKVPGGNVAPGEDWRGGE